MVKSMNIQKLAHRKKPVIDPDNWQKIPWDDPEFSPEILLEHLSQDHDFASRSVDKIISHVQWIHNSLLEQRHSNILDLGCGPGFYTQRLAELGHTCTGIDFSPASITFARKQAQKSQRTLTYHQGDIRRVDYGTGYHLVMMIFGEFNVFSPQNAEKLLRKMHHALVPGGLLLLEPHTLDGVKNLGEQTRYWQAEPASMFCRKPHLYLEESHWHPDLQIAVNTFTVLPAGTGSGAVYQQYVRGYTHGEYEGLLTDNGFEDLSFYPLFGGAEDDFGDDLFILTARKKQD